MKSSLLSLAALAHQAASHATFQQLWVGNTDFGSQCVRLPLSNNPVTNVASNDIRCNANQGAVSRKCPVAAGSTVTVEMHQQNGDRSCGSEAIGGKHYGPVMVYLSKVADATKADGSTPFFKIYEDGWSKASTASGDDDNWGVKDMNKCCGKVQVKIPSDIPAGDYLLRAEVIALHSAAGNAGAQFYISCYQITVSGGGSTTPAGVSFPGAYKASDPGILVDIHRALSSYTVPGPAVVAGGTTKAAGSACTGCESTCSAGSGPVGSAPSTPQPTDGSGPPACTVPKYQQCGGTGYTGCTTCQSGSTCVGVSAPHYYQCT